MKKLRKVGIIIGIISLLMPMWSNGTLAATGSASLSGGSGIVGATVTVSGSVKAAKAMGAATVTLSYDPSALQYISGSSGTNGGSGSAIYAGYGDGTVKKVSFTMKFKILKEGSHQISGTVDAYNMDEAQLNVGSVRATITGKVEEAKSTNTKLKSLKVYPGTLSPAFSEGTKSYTLQVPEGTKEVTVSAVTKSSKATFYVTGTTNLKEGTNYASVVVTAESGKTGKYAISIVVPKSEKKEPEKEEPKEDPSKEEPKEEGEEPTGETLQVEIDGRIYTLREDFTKEELPAQFAEASLTYQNTEVLGAKSDAYGLQLLYLEDKAGRKVFFLYQEDTFYPFVALQISDKKTIVPVPVADTDQVLPAEDRKDLILEEATLDAWNTTDKECYIFPAVGEDGVRRYYRYDVEDGTYQRFFETATETYGEIEKEKKVIPSDLLPEEWTPYYDYILLVAFGILLILLVLVVAFGINADKRRRKKLRWLKSRKEEME